MTSRRICNAALGLCLGIVTLPLAAVLWPAICSWFFFNETDMDEDGAKGAEEKRSQE